MNAQKNGSQSKGKEIMFIVIHQNHVIDYN